MGNKISQTDLDVTDFTDKDKESPSHVKYEDSVKSRLRRSLSGGYSHGSFFRRKSQDEATDSPSKDSGGGTPTRSSSSMYSPNAGKTYADCLVKLAKNLVLRSQKLHKLSGITEDSFTKFLCKGNILLGHALFSFFSLLQPNKKDNSCLSKDAFLTGGQKILDLISDSSQLEYYVRVFAYDEPNVHRKNFSELLQASFQLSQSCTSPDTGISDEDSQALEAVEKSLYQNKEELSINYLIRCLEENCPRLVASLHKSVVHQLTVGHRLVAEEDTDKVKSSITEAHFTGDALHKLTAMPATISCTSQEETSQSSLFSSAQLWLMACTLPALYVQPVHSPSKDSSRAIFRDPQALISQLTSSGSIKHWETLYDSEQHGLSLNRFQHHVFGYRGPTLLILKGENDVLFAVAVDSEWQESNRYWGGIDCIALQLLPHYKMLDRGAQLIYLNTNIRGYPFGLHVGLDPRMPWLEVDKEFALVSSRKVPYRLQRMQVLGCGSTQHKEALQQHKKWELQEVEKRRKVNLNSVEWDLNPDKYLLELGGQRPQYSHHGNV